MYAYLDTAAPMPRESANPYALGEIAKRLKLLRDALGNTQATMASLAGATPAAWGNYESGIRRIRIDEALRLCSTVGVTLDWIYRGNVAQLPGDLIERIQLELRDQQRSRRGRH